MPHIKGPIRPQIPQTATEIKQAAEKVAQSSLRPQTANEAEERQAQAALNEALLPKEKKLSAADAERLVSQAGFDRQKARRRNKNFDVGDSTGAPIPLPPDDVDDSQWSGPSLDDAQEALTWQGSALKQAMEELGPNASPEALWEKVLEHTAHPTDEDIARLKALQEQTPEPALALKEMTQHAQALFGVALADTAPGQALTAASLLVAGSGDAVQVLPAPTGKGGTLEPQKLAQGVQKVMKNGQTAVQDARGMSEGIDRNLSMHRTFVFKR